MLYVVFIASIPLAFIQSFNLLMILWRLSFNISYSCYDFSLFLSSQYPSSLGSQKYIHLYTICNFLFRNNFKPVKSCMNDLKNSYVPSTKIHPFLIFCRICFFALSLACSQLAALCLSASYVCMSVIIYLNVPVMSLTAFSSLSTISHLAFSYQDN